MKVPSFFMNIEDVPEFPPRNSKVFLLSNILPTTGAELGVTGHSLFHGAGGRWSVVASFSKSALWHCAPGHLAISVAAFHISEGWRNTCLVWTALKSPPPWVTSCLPIHPSQGKAAVSHSNILRCHQTLEYGQAESKGFHQGASW